MVGAMSFLARVEWTQPQVYKFGAKVQFFFHIRKRARSFFILFSIFVSLFKIFISFPFPSFPLSLFPSFPLSLFHSFPLSLFPSFTLFLFHSFPLSLFHSFPLSFFHSFTLSLFPLSLKFPFGKTKHFACQKATIHLRMVASIYLSFLSNFLSYTIFLPQKKVLNSILEWVISGLLVGC